ncbi:MAG: SsrA-binding protein SmpB [Peptoniphilaceae bacterium]|nr:SsrA-binding protein SmpB [Peptoniphilaceae bacterium]MCI6659807.1 SsrA-binding protein SmpB [Peptoniphilaceae bacterium]MDD7433887.1 SsrA-binding protein SmpB [Peptoniphilaceae bacterium]MDY3075196.1 SsrA-binding protein SmpB [Peptoniphilaceae bacterium]MDY3986658.1 SsrA-binding protein SmpB [Peptoniphilaceae bacterium]
MKQESRLVANNKKAKHEYFLEKIIEAGVELRGTEVKSIRQGKVSIRESYIEVRNGEAWLKGLHISPYEQGNRYNVDPIRDRRLLLHKKEIRELDQGVQRDGYTVIPLSVNIRNGLVKIDIALAKGKKLYDKRQTLKEKEAKRDIDRAVRNALK